MKKLVLFGAGKIGRSFIAQLFSKSGYEVVFVDINTKVIDALNKNRKYKVIVKSEKGDEIIWVSNVRGLLSTDTENVKEEISSCGLLAMSVGLNAIPKVVPLIAEGIMLRFSENKGNPLDIILAENLRDAAKIVKGELMQYLPDGFDFDNYVGLVETSIGKMVPIMPESVMNEDPLLVFAEPYNTLILDKKGFKNSIPQVEGLALKDNMAAWVDRKSFIHNFGHAAVAYYGYSKYPELKFIYELIAKYDVYGFARSAMSQSADVLMKHYPGEFTKKDLSDHIDDLLYRFANKALGDTVYRVGQDLYRKLGPEDRIVGVLKLAYKYKLPYGKILYTLKCAMIFNATDQNGKRSENDIRFSEFLKKNGISSVLKQVCRLDPADYPEIYNELLK